MSGIVEDVAGKTTVKLPPLPDVLAAGLRLVFVGINPSIASSLAGHHFATPGNPFWRLLHAARLTPSPLTAADDARLLELGFGLTNVCPRPTRAAAELTRAELDAGVRALARKVEALRPALVALVGVTLERVVVPGSEETGPGPRRATVGAARVYVVPNPSGRNAAFPGFASKLGWFVRLREAALAAPAPSWIRIPHPPS
jgi:TDG/mug DNA glycosylase family protein